jgi:hypothetical protein
MSTKVNHQALSASSVSSCCLTPTCIVIPPDEIAEHPERPDHQPAAEWDSCTKCPGKVLWHPQAANGWVGEAELATLRWKGKKLLCRFGIVVFRGLHEPPAWLKWLAVLRPPEGDWWNPRTHRQIVSILAIDEWRTQTNAEKATEIQNL